MDLGEYVALLNDAGLSYILGDRLTDIAELNDDDRSSLINVIDGLVTASAPSPAEPEPRAAQPGPAR